MMNCHYATPRSTGSTYESSFRFAVQIFLIASVRPTSFVSNSKNPIATTTVAARRAHQKKARVLGNRLSGT